MDKVLGQYWALVDCRSAPSGFAVIVVQGELLRSLVMLVPEQAVRLPLAPRPLVRGGDLGRQTLSRLHRGGGSDRRREAVRHGES